MALSATTNQTHAYVFFFLFHWSGLGPILHLRDATSSVKAAVGREGLGEGERESKHETNVCEQM